jgi:hypothetical protein
VAEILSIKAEVASEYVECYAKSHHAKFDITFPNSKNIAGLDHELNLNFNSQGKSCRSYLEVQIGSRSLAEFLMKRGMLPDIVNPERRATFQVAEFV